MRWEIEAPERDELRDPLTATVEPYVDRALLAEVLADEARPREEPRAFLEQ